ncbi:VanZ family protein [Microbacterium sp. M28]|uniref:VanZ family protein n=1 Tax=Microbacterium sp. M28 TaxID=2962064 RepID=UPI0021F4D510|nr:VanZ family protein [Microbacterium sp. M28]UYO96353.1 VanZ family protein [Microbacterium sp. M28]
MPASRPSIITVTARVLIVPYVIGLALIVFLPASVASRATGIAFRIARFVSDLTGISLSTSDTIFEFLANIALFVPLGVLLAAGWPRLRPWVIILVGYSASATIELTQTLLPSRVPTISDVVANTLGTIVGCLVVRTVLTTSRERARRTPVPERAGGDHREAVGAPR